MSKQTIPSIMKRNQVNELLLNSNKGDVITIFLCDPSFLLQNPDLIDWKTDENGNTVDEIEYGVAYPCKGFGEDGSIVYIPALFGNFVMTEVVKYALMVNTDNFDLTETDCKVVLIDASEVMTSIPVLCDVVYLVENCLHEFCLHEFYGNIKEKPSVILINDYDYKPGHHRVDTFKDKKKKKQKSQKDEIKKITNDNETEEDLLRKIPKIWFKK